MRKAGAATLRLAKPPEICWPTIFVRPHSRTCPVIVCALITPTAMRIRKQLSTSSATQLVLQHSPRTDSWTATVPATFSLATKERTPSPNSTLTESFPTCERAPESKRTSSGSPSNRNAQKTSVPSPVPWGLISVSSISSVLSILYIDSKSQVTFSTFLPTTRESESTGRSISPIG